MLQAYQVKGQDSYDSTSSSPVLWGVAWHPSVTPEEVHFKLVRMGSWAALLIFFLKPSCMDVLPAYMSVHVCAWCL